MPIYGFTCQQCGHQFDRLQKLSDTDPDTCPECHAKAVRRQLSAPSFRLAGGGWYETDFKGKNEKRHNLAGDGKGDRGKTVKSDGGAAKPQSGSAGKASSTASASE